MDETNSTTRNHPEPTPAATNGDDAAASRREFLYRALGVASAVALGPMLPSTGEAQGAAPPDFASPGAISSQKGMLRAVMELNSEKLRDVPNFQKGVQLRYFQGWDMATPKVKVPDLDKSLAVTPGPTLRARIGDKVEIAFFNKVDDTKFPYTFVTAEGSGAKGCDQSSNPGFYPGPDQFPNCFHGSSTANIHFHGTHVTPDGLGDNVLVQVMPNKDLKEADWDAMFGKVFGAAKIPASWNDMPPEYKTKQMADVKKMKNGAELWAFNQHQIAAGAWPQYIAGAFPNCFEISDYASKKYQMGQAPGTHWYHAHKHGSTALHILSGLAGAFIIEGDYDKFIRNHYGLGDSYPAAFEKVLVILNIDPNMNLERQTAARTGSGQQLVNGLQTPVIRMRPNEVQLWRFVNATVGSNASGWVWPDVFQTKGFQFKQTAMDGVQFSPTNYQNQPFLNGTVPNARTSTNVKAGLMLSAGNRADVLVIAPDAETPAGSPTPFTSNGVTLFYVDVNRNNPATVRKEFPPDASWPEIPEFLKDLGTPKGYPHYVTFGWDAEPQRNGGGRLTTTSAGLLSAPPHFTIDNKQFEQFGPIIDQCMPLGGLQDWVIENTTTISHPFHIHVNPFQVMEIDTPAVDSAGGVTYSSYKPSGNAVWQDVIALPRAVSVNGQVSPGRVRIRHQFVDFTGTYVLHCHILAHEDRGMMQLVRVVDAGKYPNSCQSSIPQHH